SATSARTRSRSLVLPQHSRRTTRSRDVCAEDTTVSREIWISFAAEGPRAELLRAARCRRLPPGSVACLESACLHAVPADLHVAPPARVILARIEKQPATGIGLAGAHPLQRIGQHELAGKSGQDPGRKFRFLRGTGPLPCHARLPVARPRFLPAQFPVLFRSQEM